MSTTLTIARREFRSYFDAPLAYVVICLSLFLLGIGFFAWPRPFWQVDRATMEPLFETVLYLLVLVVPVVTMKSLAEEKRSGTLEMLITLPVKDAEVILGKYLGALGLVLTFVFMTALYPLLMFKSIWHLGPLDSGPVVSGYLGLVLVSAAAVAVGLLVSSVTESQVIAFFVTFIVMLVATLVDRAAALLPSALGTPLRLLSFSEHYASFGRGLVDTTDIVFFVSLAAMALLIAFRSLESRKWS